MVSTVSKVYSVPVCLETLRKTPLSAILSAEIGLLARAKLIAAAVVAIAALCCIGAMAKKEKEGKPVFAPVHNPVNERVAEKA